MKKRDHLPIYGVGLCYIWVIAALTPAAVLLQNQPFLASGNS